MNNSQETSFSGITAKFISSVTECLPRHLGQKRMQELIDKPEKLRNHLEVLMGDAPGLQIVETIMEVDYSIPMGSLLTSTSIHMASEEMRDMQIPGNIVPLKKNIRFVLWTPNRPSNAMWAHNAARSTGLRCASVRELLLWANRNRHLLDLFPVAAAGESLRNITVGNGDIYAFVQNTASSLELDHIGNGDSVNNPSVAKMFGKQFRFLFAQNA